MVRARTYCSLRLTCSANDVKFEIARIEALACRVVYITSVAHSFSECHPLTKRTQSGTGGEILLFSQKVFRHGYPLWLPRNDNSQPNRELLNIVNLESRGVGTVDVVTEEFRSGASLQDKALRNRNQITCAFNGLGTLCGTTLNSRESAEDICST